MKLRIDPEAPRDILDEKGELVATVYNSDAFAFSDADNGGDDDSEGNDPAAVVLARQFAASGEMLAALADIAYEADRATDNGRDVLVDMNRFRRVLAALAAAEGK